jgi:hypothetical protein
MPGAASLVILKGAVVDIPDLPSLASYTYFPFSIFTFPSALPLNPFSLTI